jgi:hypothetical protein
MNWRSPPPMKIWLFSGELLIYFYLSFEKLEHVCYNITNGYSDRNPRNSFSPSLF